MIGASIFDIIIHKYNYCHKSSLIILFTINKGSKLGLYRAVLPLYPTVCLRIKSGKEAVLDFDKVIKQ